MGAKARLAAAIGVVLAVGVAVWWGSNQQTIKAKRGYAVSQLRDPDSVQFRAERLTGEGWLCGELNSKNGYGAYTGFKRFASLSEEDVWVEESGYVGKQRSVTGAHNLAIEMADAKAEFTRLHKLGSEAVGAAYAEPPASSQIEAGAIRRLFAQKWAKHCT